MSFDDVFAGTDAFDASATEAAQSTGRDRPRDKWPVLKFAVGSSGSEEVAVRITPIMAKTRGHWVKTSKDKTFWADCCAYDAHTDTANGLCPYCTIGESSTTNTISVVIDMNSYNWLMSMGYGPDKWMAPPEGTMPSPNQPLMHPFRFFSFSKSMLSQIHTVKTKRGYAASDVNQGYTLDVIKKNNNGKVEYQVIAGNTLPISEEIKAAFQRINLANPKDWHCPEKIHDIIKSMFFNNKITKEQAVSMLTKYTIELGLVSDDDKSAAIKAMESYAAKHQGEAGGGSALPPPSGMGYQSAPLPPPSSMMPAVPPPGMMPPPNPMAPQMPTAPAPMAPQMPTAPAPMAPAVPSMPSMPMAPAPTAPAPMAPAVPSMPSMPMTPSMPQMPSMPSMPMAPQSPVTSELPKSSVFTPPTMGSVPVVGATNILD